MRTRPTAQLAPTQVFHRIDVGGRAILFEFVKELPIAGDGEAAMIVWGTKPDHILIWDRMTLREAILYVVLSIEEILRSPAE